MDKHEPKVTPPTLARRIGLVTRASDPEKLYMLHVTLDDSDVSTVVPEPGQLTVISDVLPGPTPDTFNVVESTYESVSTGIYETRKEISTRRITVPAGRCRIVEFTATQRCAVHINVSRSIAAAIVGPRLTLLNDPLTTATHSIRLNLGDGIKTYSRPEDLSVEENDAIVVLTEIQACVEYLADGGSVRGAMLGVSQTLAMERLLIRPHEAAVLHGRKTKGALPGARKAKSAKLAERKQWVTETFRTHLLTSGNDLAFATNRTIADFQLRFKNDKAPKARTISNWFLDSQRSRTK